MDNAGLEILLLKYIAYVAAEEGPHFAEGIDTAPLFDCDEMAMTEEEKDILKTEFFPKVNEWYTR